MLLEQNLEHMDDVTFAKALIAEMEAEAPATRKCLERISARYFSFKPHPRSMEMGYLSALVADMPNWIAHTLDNEEFDLNTYPHLKPHDANDLVDHLDKTIAATYKALGNLANGDLDKPFGIKRDGVVLFTSSKRESISTVINHWVHHRGQLTVYMRLNDIAVPSIYGPSADERPFG
jgi:uncharacterized damage-inducible protein DinB